MKVNPEIGNVINIIRKESGDAAPKRADETRKRSGIEDVVSVENRQASKSSVDSVDEARELLSSVIRDLGTVSADLYTLDVRRVSVMIG